MFFFCEEKKRVMYFLPFHKYTGVWLFSALASQNRSKKFSRISGSADTNRQKMEGRCYAALAA
jgi:hypothetical protein